MGQQQTNPTKASEAKQRISLSPASQPTSQTTEQVSPFLQLHQTVGNRAVGRLVQAKLSVGQPNDPYEREADRVAQSVMRMPDGETPGISNSSTLIQRACAACDDESLQRKPLAASISPVIQRVGAEGEDEEETINFKSSPGHTPEVTPAVATDIDSMRGGGHPLPPSSRSFFEPRFGYDFSDVCLHTDGRASKTARQLSAQAFTVGRDIVFGGGHYNPENQSGKQLLAHELTHVVQQTPLLSRKSSVIQRELDEGAPASPAPEQSTETPAPTEETAKAPAEESPETRETATPSLLVEDSADQLAPGQMRKSDFVAELRTNVCSAADQVLASAGQSTEGCPYLDYWFDYYANKDSQHFERAIHRYAPEASSATSARDYIPIITARIRRGVETWARTGEITGVPDDMPALLPGLGSIGIAASAAASVLFKGRAGGPREAGNPQAIQAQLGRGRPIDSSVRSRMESAFGASFSHVRVHTDAGAARLSDRYNARAFTVGEHVAFGSGEYQPGTMIGDAIIAHELAHVTQQGGAAPTVAPMRIGDTGYNALEEDADTSAVGAVASLWGGTKEWIEGVAQNAMPRLRSGLRLSRCKDETCSKGDKTITVDFVRMHGSTGSPATHLTEANNVFKKCCVKFQQGQNPTPETEAVTKNWLGGDTDVKVAPNCGAVDAEEKNMYDQATAKYKFSSRMRVFYVSTYSGYGGAGYSLPPNCATGGASGYVNHVVLQNSVSATTNPLAHEFGHILLNDNNHGTAPDLMATSGGAALSDTQCKTIYNNA